MKSPAHFKSNNPLVNTDVIRARLIGFRRLARSPPALVLPVFVDKSLSNLLLYQRIDDKGNVFVFVGDPDLKKRHLILHKAAETCYSLIDSSAICAYEVARGHVKLMKCGNEREYFEKLVEEEVLLESPFAGLEIAQFLRNQEWEATYATECIRKLVNLSYPLASAWLSGIALSPKAYTAANDTIASSQIRPDRVSNRGTRSKMVSWGSLTKGRKSGRPPRTATVKQQLRALLSEIVELDRKGEFPRAVWVFMDVIRKFPPSAHRFRDLIATMQLMVRRDPSPELDRVGDLIEPKGQNVDRRSASEVHGGSTEIGGSEVPQGLRRRIRRTELEPSNDTVYCFTPKRERIVLPSRATPLDFAYAVHTDVGNHAVACKINGKIAPFISELHNGDEVEILTSKAQAAPPAEWESLLVTDKGRAALRRATRQAVRTQYAELGRRIVERMCQRAKRDYSDDNLMGALPRLARHSIDDVFAAVGRGEMKASDVIRAMYPDYKEERATTAGGPNPEPGWFGLNKGKAVPGGKNKGSAIPIRGINTDLPVRFAPDGGAVPGDRIVGIMTPGEGITIYPIQSSALKEFEEAPDRWLDVRWDVDDDTPLRFPARVAVQCVSEPGSLAQIVGVIAEHDADVDGFSMTEASSDLTSIILDVGVYDLKHLTALITAMRRQTVVKLIERRNG
jgi:hypothetical protein